MCGGGITGASYLLVVLFFSGFRAAALLRPLSASAGGGRLDKEQEILMKRFMQNKWTNRVAVAVWVAVTLAVWLLR